MNNSPFKDWKVNISRLAQCEKMLQNEPMAINKAEEQTAKDRNQ